MKKQTVFIILGVLAGLAAFVGAIIAVVFYATSGVTDAADKFYETARGGNAEQVYALTSAELRKVTSAEQLATYVEANRFDEVAQTSWRSRSVEDNVGSVEGTLTLEDGSVIPVTMQLVKEGDAWKVSFIDLGQAGVRGGTGP